MSQVELYPYPTRADALRVLFTPTVPDITIGEAGRVEAQEVAEGDHVRLGLVVSAESGTLADVLPAVELADPPVRMIITVHSVPSRYRSTVVLDSGSDGTWSGKFDMPKRELYGHVELMPALVRTSPGEDSDYAQHVGARLAWGEPVTVQIDDAPIPPGGYLNVRFDDFRDSADRRRREYPELLYMLDTESDPPMLWLNEGIPGFKAVMHAKGPRGANLRIRDAMFDTIVSQVWTSLASTAFTTLAVHAARLAESESEEDPIDCLPEWEQRVINLWAPFLYPGTRREALESVCNAAKQPLLFPELHDRLGLAIQKWAKTNQAFRGLIRLRDREGV